MGARPDGARDARASRADTGASRAGVQRLDAGAAEDGIEAGPPKWQTGTVTERYEAAVPGGTQPDRAFVEMQPRESTCGATRFSIVPITISPPA